jgi:hypothetical protein
MPGFQQNNSHLALLAVSLAGTVVVFIMMHTKHNYHEYRINIRRSYHYFNPDRFDPLNADHTRKKIV